MSRAALHQIQAKCLFITSKKDIPVHALVFSPRLPNLERKGERGRTRVGHRAALVRETVGERASGATFGLKRVGRASDTDTARKSNRDDRERSVPGSPPIIYARLSCQPTFGARRGGRVAVGFDGTLGALLGCRRLSSGLADPAKVTVAKLDCGAHHCWSRAVFAPGPAAPRPHRPEDQRGRRLVGSLLQLAVLCVPGVPGNAAALALAELGLDAVKLGQVELELKRQVGAGDREEQR